MYQNYERRRRPSRGVRLLRILIVLSALTISVVAVVAFVRWGDVERPVSEVDGIKQVSAVKDADLAIYDGAGWESRFWNGMNLGASLPGHAPGEVAPTKEDYLRWFPQMKEMNVDVLRVYTILGPEFYEALDEFNSKQEEPLWLIQGIWSPEEELVGEDEEGRDAYTPEITETFENEITDAVSVVHGDADLPERPGHASGRYRADVAEYMLGWMVGTEWYPYAAKVTNDSNPGVEPYKGEYFSATEQASPFESWLAGMLDLVAEEEMKYGWQHPVSLTNWPTTDPLDHPDESNEQEDLVSVDPMHMGPTDAWKAGYFASYHVYPAYPDFIAYEQKYLDYRKPNGQKDPYAGYLNELRAHHKDIPLIVAEYGLSTSRGMAHRAPLGRDQGKHTEESQGEKNVELLDNIHDEKYDGAILFAWEDEWFKFAWNTGALELPPTRRPMWLNHLTNEQNYGVIAAEAGEKEDEILLDGETDDWEKRAKGLIERISGLFTKEPAGIEQQEYEDYALSTTHDEAYVYLLLKKREGEWDFPEDNLNIGFGTLSDGSVETDQAPGLVFPGGGIQFLMQLNGTEDSRLLINSAYDPHTWLYGKELKYMPDPTIEPDPKAGEFLPWRLALNRPLTLPQSGREIPFQDYETGILRKGNSDPSSPNYDSLADWNAKGDTLEIRIPWMLLGATDPSTHRVWNYPYRAGELEAVETDGLRIYPSTGSADGDGPQTITPLNYTWSDWDQPAFHERKKKSFGIMKAAYGEDRPLLEPESAASENGP